MSNQTVSDWFTETKDQIFSMPASRINMFGESFLLLILMFWGRHVWLNFFHFTVFVKGILYLFIPGTANIWITGELDEVQVWLVRYMGLFCLCWAMTYFVLSRSHDPTPVTSLMLGLLVMMLSTLLEEGHMYYHPPKKMQGAMFENEDISSLILANLVGAICLSFHLFRAKDWGGFSEQPSQSNVHLKIQFVVLLVLGIGNFAMPQWSIKTTFGLDRCNTVHIFLARAVGSMFFSLAILTFRSVNFMQAADKEAMVAIQWVFVVANAMIGCLLMYSKWSQVPWSQVIMTGVVDVLIIFNITGALNRDFTVFKGEVLPRFTALMHDFRMYFRQNFLKVKLH